VIKHPRCAADRSETGKPAARGEAAMHVTVEVVGEDTREVSVGDGDTYADLIRAVDLSPHEVSVLVDGSPVPEDQPVATDRVKILRLIKGGGE
jgi:sulfur carrier protein